MQASAKRIGRRAFTIIELLVVVAIIGILMALMLPALQRAREVARHAECRANLNELGVALHVYHDANGQFPIGSGTGTPGTLCYEPGSHRKGSMLVNLLPYLEQQPLYDQLDFHGDVVAQFESSGDNIRARVIPVFVCPSDTHSGTAMWKGTARAQCNYAPSQGAQAVASSGGVCPDYSGNHFGTGGSVGGVVPDPEMVSGVFSRSVWSARFSDVTDGVSNTIAMGEIRIPCSDHPVIMGWLPTQAWLVTTSVPINFPTCPGEGPGNDDEPATDCHSWSTWSTSQGFKSLHPNGANFLMCDGSVRFLNEQIDFENLQRLGDRRDGDEIADF